MKGVQMDTNETKRIFHIHTVVDGYCMLYVCMYVCMIDLIVTNMLHDSGQLQADG